MQISSENNTILVVSDVHQDIEELEFILDREDYDTVVCLGDWFDSHYHNEVEHWEKTCAFLKKWIFKPNFHTCIGNHDIQYLFGNPTTICSGYIRQKDELITERFGPLLPKIRDKFLWYLWIDDFFCSHAGLNVHHFPPNLQLDKASINKWLDEQLKYAELPLFNSGRHWIYGAGTARGGRQPYGGLIWQDFNDEFEPIDGLKQIVGHTSHRTVVNHIEDGNVDLTQALNLDVDCHLSEYVKIINGKISIHKRADLYDIYKSPTTKPD